MKWQSRPHRDCWIYSNSIIFRVCVGVWVCVSVSNEWRLSVSCSLHISDCMRNQISSQLIPFLVLNGSCGRVQCDCTEYSNVNNRIEITATNQQWIPICYKPNIEIKWKMLKIYEKCCKFDRLEIRIIRFSRAGKRCVTNHVPFPFSIHQFCWFVDVFPTTNAARFLFQEINKLWGGKRKDCSRRGLKMAAIFSITNRHQICSKSADFVCSLWNGDQVLFYVLMKNKKPSGNVEKKSEGCLKLKLKWNETRDGQLKPMLPAEKSNYKGKWEEKGGPLICGVRQPQAPVNRGERRRVSLKSRCWTRMLRFCNSSALFFGCRNQSGFGKREFPSCRTWCYSYANANENACSSFMGNAVIVVARVGFCKTTGCFFNWEMKNDVMIELLNPKMPVEYPQGEFRSARVLQLETLFFQRGMNASGIHQERLWSS